MAYCHECGSEIKEAEGFCPFCGIALQSIPVQAEEEKEENNFIHELIEDDSENKEEKIEQVADEVGSDSGDSLETDLGDDLSFDLEMSETIIGDPTELITEKEGEEAVPNEIEEDLDVSSIQAETSTPLIDDEKTGKETPEEISLDIEGTDLNLIDEPKKDSEIADSISVESEKSVSKDSGIYDPLSEKSKKDIREEITLDAKLENVASPDAGTLAEKESNDLGDNIELIVEEDSGLTTSDSQEEQENKKVIDLKTTDFVHNEDLIDTFERSGTSASDENKKVSEEIINKGLVAGSEEDPKLNLSPENNPEVSLDVEESEKKSPGTENKYSKIASDEEFAATIPYVAINKKSDEKTSSSEASAAIKNLPGDREEIVPESDAAEVSPNVPEIEDKTDQPKISEDKAVIDNIVEVQEKDAEIFEENKSDVEAEANTIIRGSVSEELASFQKSPETSLETPDEPVSMAGASSTTPNMGKPETGGRGSSKLKPLEEGTVLNSRYEIVRKIGGGGMGAVYLASDKNLGGILRAVKEMVQSYIEEEQQDKAIQDFKRESMLLTSLEHPAIPTIYDYFFDEKEARFYLVMKYISGGDLSARLKAAPEGKLDEKSVVEWGIQVADVLDYLHNRQPPIVYRDLKPANVMIDGNSGRIMLIDFGIARWINKEEKGVTAVGTMGYAPPELFSGNVEPRSDVYSLGSTMFHLLTGADPQSNPLLIFDFQKHPRPRQINPNLSDQVERILMRSVEYNAEKRFESAGQMRDALIKHLSKLNSGQISFGVKQTPKAISLEEQPVFCGFCGQRIVASDMFCAFCGAKQPLAQPGIHSKNYVHVTTTARLMIAGTSELDSPTFVLEKNENLVGRRDPLSNIFPEVDLSKYDPQTKISRKHAKIWREGDKFLVEDLGSSNGTLLISEIKESIKLEPNKALELTNGDKIKLGDTTLQFVIQ